MASKRATWNSIGRYFSALVIAAFFLPFFGVSCDGVDVITVSGADMVGGCRPGGLISDAEDQADHAGGSRRARGGGMSDMKVDKVEREPLAIVALALIVLGFAAAWVKTKKGLLASFGLSLATLGVLVGLWLKVGGELREAVDKEALGGGELGGSMKKDVKIDAGGRYGLWLSGLLLLSIAIMTGRAMREPENMPSGPMGAPPLPPPGPPPV